MIQIRDEFTGTLVQYGNKNAVCTSNDFFVGMQVQQRANSPLTGIVIGLKNAQCVSVLWNGNIDLEEAAYVHAKIISALKLPLGFI